MSGTRLGPGAYKDEKDPCFQDQKEEWCNKPLRELELRTHWPGHEQSAPPRSEAADVCG